MDFSDYPKKDECYNASNQKVLGKMKDELSGNIMTHFIGLNLNHTVIKCMEKMKNIRGVKALLNIKLLMN